MQKSGPEADRFFCLMDVGQLPRPISSRREIRALKE
jgi:hypothetical protein